jgi:RNA polymerase sigma factor (sigma-70 family)
MTESQKLLAEYVGKGSEAAFRELVSCYVDLVYSTALRIVGDAHRAEDVTQLVFIDLARQASKLSGDSMLGGWLHRDTCFVASKVMRGERRRQLRERQAAEMNALNTGDANLEQIAPVLDEVINGLGEADRQAILLRFYERLDLRSVGEALGSSENAAQKRVSRALEELRTALGRRGVVLSAAALGTALAAEAVSAAPVGLAAGISGPALAAAGSGTALTILKLMATTKVKLAIAGALVAVGIATPLVLQQQAEAKMAEANATLKEQAQRMSQLEAENERLSNLVARSKQAFTPSTKPPSELLRLRGEVGQLRQQTNDLAKVRQENQGLTEQVAQLETNQISLADQLILKQTHAQQAVSMLLDTLKHYAANHNGQYPTDWSQVDPTPINLPGNLATSDFELTQNGGLMPNPRYGGTNLILLRVPLPKPEGGGLMVAGGVDSNGVFRTSLWNVDR